MGSSNWIEWSVGELRIDSSSFGIFFTPYGGPGTVLASKPLGCLTGASSLENSLCTYIVETNDAVHSVLKVTLASEAEEGPFRNLVRSAVDAVAARRRTLTGRPNTTAHTYMFKESLEHRLETDHPGRPVSVFPGADLYGPYTFEGETGEVLLGRGAVVLMDPVDSGRTGSYDFLFYGDNLQEPLLGAHIGPRTRVLQSSEEVDDVVILDLSLHGEVGRSIAFEDKYVAQAFMRDFRVRHAVISLSLQTSRGANKLDAIRSELEGLQGHVLRLLCRCGCWAIVAFLAVVFAHFVLLAMVDDRPPLELVSSAVADATTTCVSSVTNAVSVGSSACQFFKRGITVRSVEQCLSLDDSEMRRCVRALGSAQ